MSRCLPQKEAVFTPHSVPEPSWNLPVRSNGRRECLLHYCHLIKDLIKWNDKGRKPNLKMYNVPDNTHRDNNRDSPGQPEYLARVCGEGGCLFQNALSTKLDSWWFGTVEQVRWSRIWAGLSENQGGHALGICNDACACEGGEEGGVCVFTSDPQPCQPQGRKGKADGTRVSPGQRCCWSCCRLSRKAAATFTSLGTDTRSPRGGPAGRRMPSPRAMSGDPFL